MIEASPLYVIQSFLNSETLEDLVNTVHADVVVEEWMSGSRKVVGLDRLVSEVLEPAQQAFSESEYEILSFVTSDGLVAVHARFQGIFSGPYLGFDPTMKPVSWSFHDKFRVADGKIVEMWFCSDTHAIMTQIAPSKIP